MKKVLALFVCLLMFPGLAEARKLVIIFHAGSLSSPLAAIEKAFEERYPDIDVRREASGSLLAIRKITDLGKKADIVISADYRLIPQFLFPHFSEEAYIFAQNSMVLCYRQEVTPPDPQNWAQPLLEPRVRWAFSDPNLDPCGYRSLMSLALWTLENQELIPFKKLLREELGLELVSKGRSLEIILPSSLRPSGPRIKVRPKSVELLALIEAGVVDFAFEYRSVAMDHGLDFVEIPAAHNLGEVLRAKEYQKVSVRLKDGKLISGGPIAYGLAIVKRAPHLNEARIFLEFLFSQQGQSLLKRHHLIPVYPPKPLRP
ncbi:tungstate ABC transporter substrate-binding protein WtpA [Thermosulfuriphilus sp.]